jgi:Mn-dependent DtxR family transcriptional regulator
LDIDEEKASTDAYDLKRSLSYSTFDKLKKFIYFLENRADHRNTNYPEEIEKFVKK